MKTELSEQELFGQVRSLLHMPASAVSWAKLCTLLDAAREPGLSEQLIPYAREHLRTWPDEIRRLPRHWCARIDMGHDLPQLALVKTIVVQRAHYGASLIEALCDAITRGELCPTQVILHDHPDGTAALEPLLRVLSNTPLEVLDAPGLDRLTSTYRPLEEVMNLEHVRKLWYRDSLEQEHHQLDLLTTARGLPTLKSLGLTLSPANHERSSWASHIHNSPLRQQLEALHLHVAPYSSYSGRAQIWEALDTHGMFVDEPWTRLHTLSLNHIQIPSTLSSSRSWARLPSLHTLSLEGCVLDLEGLRGILEMYRASPITHLNLSRCHLGAQALALLAEDAQWRTRLTHLSMSQNGMSFDVAHLHDVFGGRPWPALRTLNLGFVEIRCAHLDPMEDRDGASLLPALEKLVLGSARLSESAYYALMRSALPSLHTLYCANMEVTGIEDVGRGHARTLKQMSSSPWFTQLVRLEFPSLTWSEAMCTHIASLDLPELRALYSTLDISSNSHAWRQATWLDRLDILQPETASPPTYDGRIAPHYHELAHKR